MTQATKDALADAATLQMYVLGVEHDLSYMGSIVTAYGHLHAGRVHMARQTYIAAAHHLFTAIPELR